MGICMHAVYRRGANISVPAPWDTKNPSKDVWYDHIAKQAEEWAGLGVTAVLLPPVLKTNAGHFPGADGYGVYDDYDIGSKNAWFSRETRFGEDYHLRRCIAVFAANGIDAYVDFVPHQRIGGSDGEYRYLGADGKTFNGRFAKHKAMFRGDTSRGFSPQDPVASPADDISFGDETAPIHSKEMAQGLIDAGDWLIRTLGLEGGRIDDTKGMASSFVKRWATSKAMRGKYWFGEFADGNPSTLWWWVHQSGIDGVVSAADFSIHYRLKDMCEQAGRWDMRQADHLGYAGIDPTRALTFVENQDSDTNGFGQIAFNKAAAYFYILTSEGYPAIYYRDFSKDDGCYGYGMQPHIANYMWLSTHLASGATICRHKDYQTIVYERQGGAKLLCGINNDPSPFWKRMWVPTGFGPGAHLHDYTGHAADLWTNQDGWIYLSLPPNVNGLGTVAYAPAGLNAVTKPSHRSIHQVFFGAPDLDLGPAVRGTETSVGRIWCAAGTKITLRLKLAVESNSDEAEIAVTGPGGFVVGKLGLEGGAVRVHEDGWHSLSILWFSVNSSVQTNDYELAVTYTATRTL